MTTRIVFLVALILITAPALAGADHEARRSHYRVDADSQPRYITVRDETRRGGIWQEAILYELDVYNRFLANAGIPIVLVYVDAPINDCGSADDKIIICSETAPCQKPCGPYADGNWRGWVGGHMNPETRHIQTSVLHLNDWWYSDYYGFPADHVARKSIICHEMGHVFGMGHSTDPGSTCLNHADGNFHDTEPGPHDTEVLIATHGHLHGE